MRVLFPTDFSPASPRALDCLEEIPGIREVILLHVLEVPEAAGPTFTEGLQELDREIVEGMASALRKRGLRPSSAACVARTTAVPLFIERLSFAPKGLVPRVKTRPLSHVLAALDFSPNSQKLVRFLKNLPGMERVTFSYVASKREGALSEEVEVKALLASLTEDFQKSTGIPSTWTVREGIASREILRAAEELSASSIALGTRGQTKIAELLWGSRLKRWCGTPPSRCS